MMLLDQGSIHVLKFQVINLTCLTLIMLCSVFHQFLYLSYILAAAIHLNVFKLL